ncbi:MAG: DUF1844 domain-containing protein [Deltaproteobacteria bacterium]|jgi:hypothetical protein|nr:DUF1844 domain-containing protein [Deltaproteobacteria bacterium]
MSAENNSKIDFTSFVLSLSSNVLVAMGEIPNPESGEKEEDFCLARDTIQILEMLQDKTTGNLSREEKGVLDSVLIDLRFKYLGAVKRCQQEK